MITLMLFDMTWTLFNFSLNVTISRLHSVGAAVKPVPAGPVQTRSGYFTPVFCSALKMLRKAPLKLGFLVSCAAVYPMGLPSSTASFERVCKRVSHISGLF